MLYGHVGLHVAVVEQDAGPTPTPDPRVGGDYRVDP